MLPWEGGVWGGGQCRNTSLWTYTVLGMESLVRVRKSRGAKLRCGDEDRCSVDTLSGCKLQRIHNCTTSPSSGGVEFIQLSRITSFEIVYLMRELQSSCVSPRISFISLHMTMEAVDKWLNNFVQFVTSPNGEIKEGTLWCKFSFLSKQKRILNKSLCRNSSVSVRLNIKMTSFSKIRAAGKHRIV